MEIALISLLGLAAIAGVAFYTRLAAHLPQLIPVRPDFGRADAVFASLLSLAFVWLIYRSLGRTFVVTPQAITESILLYFCIVCIILGFLVGRGRDPVALFGLKWPGWRRGILFVLVALVAAFPVIYVSLLIAQALGAEGGSQDVVVYLQTTKSLPDRLLMVFMAIIAAPVAEEMIFRGYLHGVIRKYGGRWCGIAVNSLLFAAIHGHIPSLAGLFVLAVALSLVYERTGSLWAPMLMHASFNSITVIVALTWPDLPK